MKRESQEALQQNVEIHATTCHTVSLHEEARVMQTKRSLPIPLSVAPFVLSTPSLTLHDTIHRRRLESVKSGRMKGLPVRSAAVSGEHTSQAPVVVFSVVSNPSLSLSAPVL